MIILLSGQLLLAFFGFCNAFVLVKRMDKQSGNWSPSSAANFLLSDQDHSSEHSETKREEAFKHWQGYLTSNKPETRLESQTATSKQRPFAEQSQIERTQSSKPKTARQTEREKVFNKLLKQGFEKTKAFEEASRIVLEQEKGIKQERINPVVKKLKKDANNARRRAKYAIDLAHGTLPPRKKNPEGYKRYDSMYKNQLKKHLSQGLSNSEAEIAAKAYTDEKREKNRLYSADYHARKRKEKWQKSTKTSDV